jgi:S-adenosylmethionine hydrolase
MPTITLLTDFGIDDEYVGLMKGVILSINPSAAIVDITHQIDPQDLIQAAFTIKSSYCYFPKNTVHLIIVDPGVGGKRDIIAVQMMGHIFIAPDNGVLTLIYDEGNIDAIVRIENSTYFLKSVSQTFHGRDIIAPVGAHIANGVDLNRVGAELGLRDIVRLPDLRSSISQKGELIGKIVSIDRFGNLITNIESKQLNDYCQRDQSCKPQIWIGQNIVVGITTTYESAAQNQPLALIGSRGFLEVAVNKGCAKQHFNVKKGDRVKVII